MSLRKPIDEDDDLSCNNGRVSPSSGTDAKKSSYYEVRTAGGYYENSAKQLQALAGEQKKTKKQSGSRSSFIGSIKHCMSSSYSNSREGEDEEDAQKDRKEKLKINSATNF